MCASAHEIFYGKSQLFQYGIVVPRQIIRIYYPAGTAEKYIVACRRLPPKFLLNNTFCSLIIFIRNSGRAGDLSEESDFTGQKTSLVLVSPGSPGSFFSRFTVRSICIVPILSSYKSIRQYLVNSHVPLYYSNLYNCEMYNGSFLWQHFFLDDPYLNERIQKCGIYSLDQLQYYANEKANWR
mgnify:CR=1 FL=1